MTTLDTLARKAHREKKKARTARLSTIATACEEPAMVKSVRVNGPYRDRDKWRIYLIDESGRKNMLFSTPEEAQAMKEKLEAHARHLTERTVGQLVDEYHQYRLETRAVAPKTAEDMVRYLRDLFPLDLPILSLTPERAQRCYLDYAHRPNRRTGKPISAATHHWVLLVAKCFAKWLVKSGVLAVNPFVQVEPIGKVSTGKVQLTRDEAQQLSAHLVRRYQAGDLASVGVLMMLHLGLRQGEVSARVARDIDTQGQVLMIPYGKTAHARRRLRVPAWLQPLLRKVAEGKKPDDLLFGAKGQRRRIQYWWRKVGEYCNAAGVPRVCPHSLRGLHATLAIEEGTSGEAVARALGHTSFTMTAKHYASTDSVENARVHRAASALMPSAEMLAELLSQMTPEARAELFRRFPI